MRGNGRVAMVVKLRFPATESFVCRQLANVADIVMRAYEDSASRLVEKGADSLKFLGRCLLFRPVRIPAKDDWRIHADEPLAAQTGVRCPSLALGNPNRVAGQRTGEISKHREVREKDVVEESSDPLVELGRIAKVFLPRPLYPA